MGRVVHFEIHAEQPERAITFYQSLFGWTFQRWGEMAYWMIRTGDGPGIDGGLVQRMGPAPAVGQPVNGYPCTIKVDDLDATLAQAAALGARPAVPKMAIPGVGWLAYLVDTEANIFGVMQDDPEAA